MKNNLLNLEFKYWFIGFTEGDGSFIINSSGSLEFKVTQSSIDSQILFYIKNQLGFGSVSTQDKSNKTHHFRVRDKGGFLKLIEIFNGNLYTEKKSKQFKSWLNAFNKVYKESICLLDNKNIPTLANAWLSGFTDAEGCFTASVIKRSETYNQVQVGYILAQKGEFDLMTKISVLLNGKVHFFANYEGHILTVSLAKLPTTLRYFRQYCLKTKKYLDYFNWVKVYKLAIKKSHFNENELNIIKNIISKINKKLH